MRNLSPEVCRKFKEARRNAGLSQSVLSAEVGCKQSALSMFEQGDGTKLNDAVIDKLAKRFNISLAEAADETPGQKIAPALRIQVPHSGFCPNPLCPSHHSYRVEGRLLLRPDRTVTDPVGGRFCAVCGELLERRCPNCGGEVHDGAVCSYCGSPYVASAE